MKKKNILIILRIFLLITTYIIIYSIVLNMMRDYDKKIKELTIEKDMIIENKNTEIKSLYEELKKREELIEEKDNNLAILNDKYKELENNYYTMLQSKKENPDLSFRLTSYYPEETSNYTGSGLTTNDFEINDKGWYIYDGKVVFAAATEELLKSGYNINNSNIRQNDKYYFNYYDTFTVSIDGTEYEAIVLDSCGVSMWEGYHRIDLFVSSEEYAIDRTDIKVWID